MDSEAGPSSGSVNNRSDGDVSGIVDAHAFVANEIREEGKHLSKINDYKTFTQVGLQKNTFDSYQTILLGHEIRGLVWYYYRRVLFSFYGF